MPDYPSGLDLSGQDLSGADLRHANLSGHDLVEANLTGTDLRHANLRGANLSRANLGGADLRHANLGGANLAGAELSGADLGGANLGGTDLRGVSAHETRWPEGFRAEDVVGADEPAPTFAVMVEGTVYAWGRPTISVPEIRLLGNLPEDRPVVEVELAGGEDFGPVAERPLKDDHVHEVSPLEPGKGVVKKVEFRRA